MSGVYGNYNLLHVRGCQYITFAGASDVLTNGLDWNTEAVTLYATEDCWVNFGTSPTAAVPGGEKTEIDSFFLPSGVFVDVAVPRASDQYPIKIAAIQNTTGGNLYIYQRKST